MPRRDPAEARLLGLWTAGWLFALLLAGLLWIGNPGVQWPVLVVPVLWALVAARPRRGPGRGRGPGGGGGRGGPHPPDRLDDWPPRADVAPTWQLPAQRPLPPPPGSRSN